MKTSNKLLLILALAGFLSTFSVMLYAKSKMITKDEYREQLKLSGKIVDRVLLENLTTNDIEMGDNFQWIIDPNSTKVVVSGDQALVSKLEVADSGQFRIRTGGVDYHMVDEDFVTVTVGTKNLKEMKIEGEGNASITAQGPLSLDDVYLGLRGNSRCNLEVDSPQMEIISQGNARITLTGQTESIHADVSGNGRLNLEELSVIDVVISASGNGKYYGGHVESISGNGSGNALIKIESAPNKSNVSTSGNAKFTINR